MASISSLTILTSSTANTTQWQSPTRTAVPCLALSNDIETATSEYRSEVSSHYVNLTPKRPHRTTTVQTKQKITETAKYLEESRKVLPRRRQKSHKRLSPIIRHRKQLTSSSQHLPATSGEEQWSGVDTLISDDANIASPHDLFQPPSNPSRHGHPLTRDQLPYEVFSLPKATKKGHLNAICSPRQRIPRAKSTSLAMVSEIFARECGPWALSSCLHGIEASLYRSGCGQMHCRACDPPEIWIHGCIDDDYIGSCQYCGNYICEVKDIDSNLSRIFRKLRTVLLAEKTEVDKPG